MGVCFFCPFVSRRIQPLSPLSWGVIIIDSLLGWVVLRWSVMLFVGPPLSIFVCMSYLYAAAPMPVVAIVESILRHDKLSGKTK